MLIRDDETALAILHQLRAIGVRIALDDFGTGYSSLSYLKRFPFDKIKIDRCFVSDIEFDGSSAIVRAVVNIAASRNMTTTAEGVETEPQRNCCASSAVRRCRATCSARPSRPPSCGGCWYRSRKRAYRPDCSENLTGLLTIALDARALYNVCLIALATKG